MPKPSGSWMAMGTRVSPRLFDGHTLITTGLLSLYRALGCERMLVVPALALLMAAILWAASRTIVRDTSRAEQS